MLLKGLRNTEEGENPLNSQLDNQDIWLIKYQM